MRLDKYLSDMGEGTRSQLKKMIKDGRVTVDGITEKDPGAHVSADSVIFIGDRKIAYEDNVYLMMNKPAGVLSAARDPRQETVLDLIEEPKRKDLFPAGRLDIDTTGLLLITNDGKLAHYLLSPAHHVDKSYKALIEGKVTEDDVSAFAKGFKYDEDLVSMPAELEILEYSSDMAAGNSESQQRSKNSDDVNGSYDEDEKAADTEAYGQLFTTVLVTIREGKFHQIKKMFHARGKEVLKLQRVSFGTLKLDDKLKEGEYRRLTSEEIKELMVLIKKMSYSDRA
ncbi:MAG: pseudouridine synthase [Lachnospiraceae bacterium]|jgi:16S rRNA pseudouridine516 synthase|nr:pseudouridine synthase [Lachnospiraceae bacterium]MEE3461503.1 pseudouridine synthase [Lachnospiraceae bacterium]